MSVFSVTLKTHNRKEITDQFETNPCILHGVQPKIFESVVGRRKDTMYTALCICNGTYNDDCGKIAGNAEEVVEAWNKWNPVEETSIVRNNLMNEPGYSPYCGSVFPEHPNYHTCSAPRMSWDKGLSQFKCPCCGWVTELPADFIERYKAKWNKL